MDISRRSFGLGALATLAPRFPLADEEVIRIGLTPVFLDDDVPLLLAFQNYLSRAIGRKVEMVKRRTYQEITDMLVSGQLHAAWICGFPYVQHMRELSLLAVPVYRGAPLYQSYIITHVDSDAVDLPDLKGHIHAFSDPNSNSGYLVTLDLLSGLNKKPAEFFQRFFFTYGHRNVIRAVASGLADSGSVDGYVWDILSERSPSLVQNTKVLRRSEPLGFPPFASNSKSHRSELIQLIERALWDMGDDKEGHEVLDLLGLDGMARPKRSLFDGINEKVVRLTAQGWL